MKKRDKLFVTKWIVVCMYMYMNMYMYMYMIYVYYKTLEECRRPFACVANTGGKVAVEHSEYLQMCASDSQSCFLGLAGKKRVKMKLDLENMEGSRV